MAQTAIQTFYRGHYSAWKWENTADAAFVTWVQAVTQPGDHAVDRTGSTPALTWTATVWDPDLGNVDDPRSVPLVTGGYYIPWMYALNFEIIAADTEIGGYWESDQYGRPYNLNDLLA